MTNGPKDGNLILLRGLLPSLRSTPRMYAPCHATTSPQSAIKSSFRITCCAARALTVSPQMMFKMLF